MSFKIESFITLRITVTDVGRSRDWYKQLFNQEPYEDLEDFVSFKINGNFIDLCLADDKSPVSTGGSVGYWLVNDLDSLLSRVEQIGGKIYRGPLRVNETQRTILQVQDPFGNVIGFEAPF